MQSFDTQHSWPNILIHEACINLHSELEIDVVEMTFLILPRLGYMILQAITSAPFGPGRLCRAREVRPRVFEEIAVTCFLVNLLENIEKTSVTYETLVVVTWSILDLSMSQSRFESG